ncbi:MAG TPA: cobalamin-binding protein [Candidatus Thioglobus sp.]|jgi:methylmalonyl-CoA mutase cobalamin-binding domain/chain|nr:cobalamin-binding protein [Candidatus Thioglobus sp.]
MSDEDDFDLNELDDKDLVEQIQDDLYDGLANEVTEGTEILLSRGWDANDVLGEALVGGMKIVGVDFRDGILFVPEVLKCAGAMKGGMKILRPILAEAAEDTSLGKFVIGTVKGDIHDIGKNLVGMMLEGAGFEVIDLGINNPVENYLEAVDKHQPVIVGMSALLTTTMPYMGVVSEEFEKRGLRKDIHMMCGGAPLNQEFADAIGVPAYGRDAARSSEMAETHVRERKNKRAHR